jgi:poly(3-hydroxybutyrate) depolymerase
MSLPIHARLAAGFVDPRARAGATNRVQNRPNRVRLSHDLDCRGLGCGGLPFFPGLRAIALGVTLVGCGADGADPMADTEAGSTGGTESTDAGSDGTDSTSNESTTSTSTSTSDPSASSTTDDTAGSTGTDDSTGEDPTGDPVLPPTSPACGEPLAGDWLFDYQLEWGAWTQATSITVNGQQRSYIVVLPPGYDPNVAYPVHMILHAWTGTMDQGYGHRVENQWSEPMIAVAPQGQPVQGGGYGWEWWETDSRDYAFIDALIHDLGDHVCVDNERLFVTGTSNGGYMANMLGGLTGYFRGVAASAGGMPIAPSACQTPTTAFLMHGSADTVVPLSEGVGARDRWLMINGCSNTTQSAVGGACNLYSDCSSGDSVYWCQHGGGHAGSDPNALGLSQPMVDIFQAL